MNTLSRTLWSAALLLGFAGAVCLAQTTSKSTTIQCKLTGVPDGNVNLTVQVYDAPTGGNIVRDLPAVQLTGVPVVGGLVNVTLPIEGSRFDNPASGRYLGIKVNGGPELQPRTPVTSVPMAMNAWRLNGREPAVASPATNTYAFCVTTFTEEGAASEPIAKWYTTDAPASLFRAIGTPWHNGAGLDFVVGNNISSPVITMYNYPGNCFEVREVDYQQPHAQATPIWRVDIDGNVSHHRLKLSEGGNPTSDKLLDCMGLASVRVLQITGGADIAEPVGVTTSADMPEATPGMVMVIDRNHDGQLVPCTSAYDRAVAGVISGANDLLPGMVLSAQGQVQTSSGDGTMPLAMAGRVWVQCDASLGAIHRGDALTTSTTPGHAMVAHDQTRAIGSVIGKAMTELREGKGLVLVLVNLQ